MPSARVPGLGVSRLGVGARRVPEPVLRGLKQDLGQQGGAQSSDWGVKDLGWEQDKDYRGVQDLEPGSEMNRTRAETTTGTVLWAENGTGGH